ncbi:MAG: hypothetical protein AAFO72_05285 [Pseudomonadota bacterium]
MEVLIKFDPLLDLAHVIATISLALIAYLYSRKTTRMNFIMQSTEMLNSVNSEYLANEENLAAIAELRQTPGRNLRQDYLMLNNLNYLHEIWALKQERAIHGAMAEAKLDNGALFWVGIKDKEAAHMLARGFPGDFQVEMLERIARQKEKLPQYTPS